MSTTRYLEYFDSAIGLYNQGLDLLNPEKDDNSIIAGCILIAVGFEKFIKFVLEQENQLMVLEKVVFKDIVNMKKGKKIGSNETEGSKKTVSLQDGFDRLAAIFPDLKVEESNLKKIVDDRNFLVHGSGDLCLSKIEGRIRVYVTSISELICSVCLNKNPVEIFGEETWNTMTVFKKAYKEAEVLELNKRLDFLKRLYSQGEKLSCQKIILLKDKQQVIPIPITATYSNHTCPICENNDAQIETDWDIDYDRDDFGEYVPTGAYPSLNAYICSNCGFTLSDSEEIEILIGTEEVKKIFGIDDESPMDYSSKNEDIIY
jgi:hypothetical protein